MGRNERGHDSPVFEVVSGLKLSSHLKWYPSSVRGRLTHTAHIKAPFLYTHIHTHTLTNKHKLHPHDLGYTLLRNTHCFCDYQGLSRQPCSANYFYRRTVANHSFLHRSSNFGVNKARRALPLYDTRSIMQHRLGKDITSVQITHV